jgi:hypothetical protein
MADMTPPAVGNWCNERYFGRESQSKRRGIGYRVQGPGKEEDGFEIPAAKRLSEA